MLLLPQDLKSQPRSGDNSSSSLQRALTVSRLMGGPRFSPAQQVLLYTPGEWETFVREWATSLEPKFFAVEQFGGGGDRGIDIAGFHTNSKLEGPWQCFQCKHYSSSLIPSDLWPELTKVISGTQANNWTFPVAYTLVAPRGSGTTLSQLLASPSNLKKGYLKYLDSLNPSKILNAESIEKIKYFASNYLDYKTISSAQLADIVIAHQTTPSHLARFGGSFPERPTVSQPPAEHAPEEACYVGHLLRIYPEKYGQGPVWTVAQVNNHKKAMAHLLRQRQSFYSAESLRVFARDTVPEDTFTTLKNEIYEGIIETYERDYRDGYERLSHVLEASTQLMITSNALIQVLDALDRKGLCHHLANDNVLTWHHEEAI